MRMRVIRVMKIMISLFGQLELQASSQGCKMSPTPVFIEVSQETTPTAGP
jgi:hypothetical protein